MISLHDGDTRLIARLQARYQACIAVMERDHGFRFTADVSIRTDGAVIFNKKG